MASEAIPKEFPGVIAYLICRGAADAIAFYVKAFDATETFRMDAPNGKVGHAELRISGGSFFLADEFAEMGCLSPQEIGGSPVSLMFYCEDVDKLFAQAIAAGAEELRAVKDQFYGDRSGTLKDPFGHTWTIATHKEDLTMEELQARGEKAMGEASGS